MEGMMGLGISLYDLLHLEGYELTGKYVVFISKNNLKLGSSLYNKHAHNSYIEKSFVVDAGCPFTQALFAKRCVCLWRPSSLADGTYPGVESHIIKQIMRYALPEHLTEASNAVAGISHVKLGDAIQRAVRERGSHFMESVTYYMNKHNARLFRW